MNLIHRVYCRSRIWRAQVRALLPWALDGISLERSAVLELGPGPGLTTDWLVPRLGSLTCVEYDEADASALHVREVAIPYGGVRLEQEAPMRVARHVRRADHGKDATVAAQPVTRHGHLRS